MPSLLLQSVPFVNSSLAGIALATGLIPLIVHLINRRRYRRVRWAAMSFLLAARKRNAKRIFIEQWVLMLIRMAVIVLFGLALARPYSSWSSLTVSGSSRSHHILLIDDSLSMAARGENGPSRFEGAKQFVEHLVRSFEERDSVSIVTLSKPAQVKLADGFSDRRLIRERLASLNVTQRGTDTVGALSHALELIHGTDTAPGNSLVYLISDLPRIEWEIRDESDPSATVAAARKLADALPSPASSFHVVQVSSVVGPNVAVTGLTADARLISVGHPLRLVVEVSNFGSTNVRGATLQILQDGQIIRREPLGLIKPDTQRAILATVALHSAGTHVLEARITGVKDDALEADDVRYLSIDVRDKTHVLLVDGRPGASPLSGEAGFLATAFAPEAVLDNRRQPDLQGGQPARQAIEPRVISEFEMERITLPDYDLVALCNVEQLSEKQWLGLEHFVRNGGGLMVFVGDLVSVDNYNRFGYAEGKGLLPGRLGRYGANAESEVALAIDRFEHPLVSELTDHANSGLFLARVSRYLPLDIVSPGGGQIAIRYTNGAPAFVTSEYGDGRVLLCTTTANMNWTNLPAKGDFVSLMINAVAYLAPKRGALRNILVGGTARERLMAGQQSLPIHVITPGGTTAAVRIVAMGKDLAAEYGPVESRGTLPINIGNDTVHFVVNVDSAESDLRSVEHDRIASTLDRKIHVTTDTGDSFAKASGPRSNELASVALMFVMLLAFSEMLLAMWFGSFRAAGRSNSKERNSKEIP